VTVRTTSEPHACRFTSSTPAPVSSRRYCRKSSTLLHEPKTVGQGTGLGLRSAIKSSGPTAAGSRSRRRSARARTSRLHLLVGDTERNHVRAILAPRLVPGSARKSLIERRAAGGELAPDALLLGPHQGRTITERPANAFAVQPGRAGADLGCTKSGCANAPGRRRTRVDAASSTCPPALAA